MAVTFLPKQTYAIWIKARKEKKPNLDILKFFSSKYLGPVYLGPEEQEQRLTLRRVSLRW